MINSNIWNAFRTAMRYGVHVTTEMLRQALNPLEVKCAAYSRLMNSNFEPTAEEKALDRADSEYDARELTRKKEEREKKRQLSYATAPPSDMMMDVVRSTRSEASYEDADRFYNERQNAPTPQVVSRKRAINETEHTIKPFERQDAALYATQVNKRRDIRYMEDPFENL